MACPASPSFAEVEDTAPPEGVTERRRNSSWKNFNFKRQLSKVDVKLKSLGSDKRGSIFYSTEAEEGVPEPPVSPGVDDFPTEIAEEAAEVESPKMTISRPDNLLLEEEISGLGPVRPPRGVKKKTPVKIHPVRAEVRDLRDVGEDFEAQPPQQTSVSFMRRFSKCLTLAC